MFRFRTLALALTTMAASIPAVAANHPGQALLDEARGQTGVPGMTAAVITSSDIRTFAAGVRRAGSPLEVARDDAFHIGSDLKAMVATIIAQEVEAGRLRWDTTIGEVLPEVMLTARAEYRNVTLSDLLRHRAGVLPLLQLEDLAVVPRLKGTVMQQRQQFARWVLTQPAQYPPGTTESYANSDYVIAAAMLEKVTGKRTEDLLFRRLFIPLRMDSARFSWPAAQPRQLAFEPWGHASVQGKFVPANPFDPESHIPEWLNPAGNLSLDARDFARFVQLHLRGLRGQSTFLDPTTFRMLHTSVQDYAMGWAVIDAGGVQFSFHGGGTDLFHAVMVLVPAADRAAIVMANGDNPDIEEAATVLASQLLQVEP